LPIHLHAEVTIVICYSRQTVSCDVSGRGFSKLSCQRQGQIQPVRLGGTISVIFGGQVSIRVHHCKKDEVYITTLVWQDNDGKMALYRKYCFPKYTNS